MQIEVTPNEYRTIQDLRKKWPPPEIQPDALKPVRWMIEADYFARDHGVNSPAALAGKGSSAIALWDEEGQALLARKRDRARNSDALLRIQVLNGASQETVLQMIDKLRIVVATDWEHLIYGGYPSERRVISERKQFYEGDDWYAVLPRPEEQNAG